MVTAETIDTAISEVPAMPMRRKYRSYFKALGYQCDLFEFIHGQKKDFKAEN